MSRREKQWIVACFLILGSLSPVSFVTFATAAPSDPTDTNSAAPETSAPKLWNSFAVYGGPGSPSRLMDLIRFQLPVIEPFWNMTIAYNRRLFSDIKHWAVEGELSTSHHFEGWEYTTFQFALMGRWFPLPWNKVINGSFAMGLGLSYAIKPPQMEVLDIGRSTNLMVHLVFEYSLDLVRDGPWQAFFRVHHRSGGYGLFDGIVGGSDFLCAGARFRFR